VFAAGKGVRLEPLTANRPKHLLPVAGAPLIEHSLRSIKAAGIKEVLLVVYHMKEKIISHLGDGSRLGLRIEYADQGGVFGTGHALGMGKDFVQNEPFLVLYGDIAARPDTVTNVLSGLTPHTHGVLAGIDLPDVREYGALEIQDGSLKKITEKPERGGRGTINGGIYVLTPGIFDFVEKTPKSERGEVELTTTLNLAIKGGCTFAVKHLEKGAWVDVGRPWNVLDANSMLMDSQEGRIDGKVEKNATIKGNVIVEEGAEVLSGAFIEGPSYISSGCKVGPNCHLRPYTYLCSGVKVGNACEIKASILMEGAHVGHLSYIGDSVIGSRCNLGAGTITANLRFDELPIKMKVKGETLDSGRKKLGVILGDDVKTGINVSLFPGVKVGQGSWIGPHVPLYRDVEPETLVTAKVDLQMRQRR
jgi:bifunctional UDP-N-acetylglucosamine pyrophosphorylase/glucosamine-1-phosphate N-acetyltransferase